MTGPGTVLVLGSGGREHAIAAAVAKDPAVRRVVVAPGNPGTAALGNRDVDSTDPVAVVALARELAADLVVIGPEAPLVAGVADALRAAGFAVFGPSAAAAQIEASKAFAKEVMARAGIPTAAARSCATAAEVAAALDEFGAPHVVKDDGLAAGKGVLVTGDRAAAIAHAEAVLQAGHIVLVEDFLDGPEVSLFGITDGTTVLPMLPAQDYKRAYDGGAGPNTGGMGAYAPLAAGVTAQPVDELVDEAVRRVLQPAIDELARGDTPFAGLLYAGLALTSHGLAVVEFNARFGDPETQPLLSLLRTPLAQVLYAAATGRLAEHGPLEFDPGYAVGVVLAAEGYPARPVPGGELTGVPASDRVFHAGTALDAEGRLTASGGRVVNVVGRGADLPAARAEAYTLLAQIQLPGGFHRTDIADLPHS